MRLQTTKPRNTIRQVLGIVGTALAVLILVFGIYAFCFGSVVGPNRHTTVCDRSWPPFLGSPGGPCFEIGFFFYGLENQVPTV